MRRRLLTLSLAALVALIMAVPLWAALRSERNLPRTAVDASGHYLSRSYRPGPPIAEAATLAVSGAVLLGLASAVRRGS